MLSSFPVFSGKFNTCAIMIRKEDYENKMTAPITLTAWKNQAMNRTNTMRTTRSVLEIKRSVQHYTNPWLGKSCRWEISILKMNNRLVLWNGEAKKTARLEKTLRQENNLWNYN